MIAVRGLGKIVGIEEAFEGGRKRVSGGYAAGHSEDDVCITVVIDIRRNGLKQTRMIISR